MIKKILITVMTYPTLSSKYFETVCTAGVLEDGSWIRLYPVSLRMLKDADNKYHKWDWIEVDVERNKKDFRIESYKVKDPTTIRVLGQVNTGRKRDWRKRRSLLFKNKKVYTSMSELLRDTKESHMSLALFKPSQLLDFSYEPINIENLAEKRTKIEQLRQSKEQEQSLFPDEEFYNYSFTLAEQIPYKFKYKFLTDEGMIHNLMVEDWELCMLYRNCLKGCIKEESFEKVRQKYFTEFSKKDVYFILGTNFHWHNKNASKLDQGKNPYMIIGVFYPPKPLVQELDLFSSL